MKTSSVLASFLLSSLAAAVPLVKRDYVTTTELVVETVVIYTTVYDDAPAAAAHATSQPGLFYEGKSSKQPEVPAKPTSQYTPPAAPSAPAQQPSSKYTPPAAPSAAPQPSSVYTPPAAPSAPAPAPSAPAPSAPAPAPSAPAQAPSSAAPAPAQSSAPASNNGGGNGQQYHGDITIYDNTGANGACGKPVHDGDKIVALAQPLWGKSTYDVMTGEATNPWCNKKIKITYKGKTVDATIVDMCPGCSGADLDLSYSLWQELTGTSEKTRFQADWTLA